MSGIFVLNSAMPTLIPWAFTSTLLILAVLTVRWLTRNRLSSVNRYALWAVVLIRLLIPIQLPFLSSLGAVDFAPQMEDTPVYAFPTDHIDAPESYIQHIWEEQGEDPVMSAGITSRGFPALGGLGFDYYSGGTVLEENGYTYPVVMDEGGELFMTYGVFSYPTTFMIDRDGNVFGYAAGQLSMEMMESIIRQTVTGVREQPGQ